LTNIFLDDKIMKINFKFERKSRKLKV